MTYSEEAQKNIDDAVTDILAELQEDFLVSIDAALQITPLPDGDVRIVRTTGGPHIEIDTHHQCVIGRWAGKRSVQFFDRELAQRIADHCDFYGR